MLRHLPLGAPGPSWRRLGAVCATWLGLALAGCGGGDSAATRADDAPTPTATASGVPLDEQTGAPDPVAPSRSAAPVATGTAGAVTGLPEPVQRPGADGDVDGDGQADGVQVRSAGSTYTLVVTLDSGRTLTVPVTADSDGPPDLAGITDADGDGRAEVFLTTAHGASTTFVTPYRLTEAGLREVTLDAQPVRLGFGGSVTHGDGFSCDRDTGELTLTRVDSPDGMGYEGTATRYRWADATLVRVGEAPVSGGPDDEAVSAGYTVSCGSLGD